MSKEANVFWAIAGPIIKGEFKKGDVIPSYSVLADHFDISINTVSRVAYALRMCGFIEGRQGEASYVVDEWRNFWTDRLERTINAHVTTTGESFPSLAGIVLANHRIRPMRWTTTVE